MLKGKNNAGLCWAAALHARETTGLDTYVGVLPAEEPVDDVVEDHVGDDSARHNDEAKGRRPAHGRVVNVAKESSVQHCDCER